MSNEFEKKYSDVVKGIEEGTGKQLGADSSLVNAFPEGERQKEIALDIINSLKEKIKLKEIKVIISVGVRDEMRKYYEDRISDLKLDGGVYILSGITIEE